MMSGCGVSPVDLSESCSRPRASLSVTLRGVVSGVVSGAAFVAAVAAQGDIGAPQTKVIQYDDGMFETYSFISTTRDRLHYRHEFAQRFPLPAHADVVDVEACFRHNPDWPAGSRFWGSPPVLTFYADGEGGVPKRTTFAPYYPMEPIGGVKRYPEVTCYRVEREARGKSLLGLSNHPWFSISWIQEDPRRPLSGDAEVARDRWWGVGRDTTGAAAVCSGSCWAARGQRSPPGGPEDEWTDWRTAQSWGAGGSALGIRVVVQDPDSSGEPAPGGRCTPTEDVLRFVGGYTISMCYRMPDGSVGQARAGIWASGQAGLLWFFDRGNAEVLVKVLDGCDHNGYRWVFVAPVTDLEFNLWVTGPNGRRWTHSNTQGATAATKSDTRAFACSDEGA